MRRGPWRIAVCFLLASGVGGWAGGAGRPAGAAAVAAMGAGGAGGGDISGLLEQLADSDPAVRVRAYRQLSDAGVSARPRLLAALIDDLASTDPAVRSSAALRLADLGAAAGPALERAAAAPFSPPQVRQALAAAMLQGPWTQPSDSPAVEQLMHGYARADTDTRQATIRQLGDMSPAQSQDALLRIVQRDPTMSIRWCAAAVLRTQAGVETAPLDRLPTLAPSPATAPAPPEEGPFANESPPPPAPNPPLLALCGWACRHSDPARTDRLLRTAVNLDTAAPAALHGELDFAYLWLVDRALEAQDFQAAASLLRLQTGRLTDALPADADAPADPVARLFALHALHGPLPGLDADLWRYRTWLIQPAVLYALAELDQRRNQPAAAAALRIAAVTASGLSAQGHAAIGSFLGDQGWLEPAEDELRIALALVSLSRPPGPARPDEDDGAANIYFQLAHIAALADNELSVARWLEHAVRALHGRTVWRTTAFGETTPWSTSDAWAEVHWHYLRAARLSGDTAAMHQHLQQLLELDKLNQVLKTDPGLASDVAPALAETGHPAEARQCFDAAYDALHHTLSAHPDDPEASNDLAWLCARCRQHLPEAVRLADAAVAAAPGTSAYLDTDAEAHFQMGRYAQALQLETRAVQLTPQDHFMQQQLVRFRAAASSATPPVPATQPAPR